MDFTYERDERDLGPGWNPLRDTFQRPNPQPSSSSTSSFNRAPSFPPSQPLSTFGTPSPFVGGFVPREGTPGFNPPGGFAAYAHQKSPPPEPEIYDVSMTSDMPSPQKDEPPPPVLESDAEDSPVDPKKNKGRFGGKLIRRLVGKKGKKDEASDSPTKRRKRRNSSASDGDDEYEPTPMVPHVYNVNFPAPHPPANKFPEELKTYTKLFFVALAGVIGLLLFWVFLTTLSSDVAAKVAEYSGELLHEINTCSELYLINKCHPETRVPAMATVCQQWERCMNKDPKNVSRLRVYAETIGEMFNGFVDELSFRSVMISLAFLAVLALVLWWMAWMVSSIPRSSPPPAVHPSHAYPLHMLPPATPSRMQYPGTQLSLEDTPYPYNAAIAPDWRAWTPVPGAAIPQTPTRQRQKTAGD
ncbi:hypothetical protein FRC04_005870 [Tulasnella sp. 424]|nr:hypothetical protein FRC04_005870 [Tulasnella sp. 424]KAG8976014.1 hypothetical protein FRC05_004645 [Tulasnella sp. 425]